MPVGTVSTASTGRLLEKRGALSARGPEDALLAYSVHSLQQRLRWMEVDIRPLPRKQPRCALLEGFSLQANMHLHVDDRQGLERLCRYGARGALALERLSRAEGGRRGASDAGAPGTAHGECKAGPGARATPAGRVVLMLKP